MDEYSQSLFMTQPTSRKRSLSPDADEALPVKRRHYDLPTLLNYHDAPPEEHNQQSPFKYDIHEALPLLPSSHPAYKHVIAASSEGTRQIASSLRQAQSLSSEIDALVEKMGQKKKVNSGKILKIGLIGDSGAGKSTFTNALLGQKALALQGGGSKSCTLVINEYRDHGEAGGPLKMCIIFKSPEEINADITKHFRAYVDFKGSASAKPMKKEDQDENQHSRDTAEEYLLQVFAEYPGQHFAAKDKLQHFVKKLSPTQITQTIQALQDHAGKLTLGQLRGEDCDIDQRYVEFQYRDAKLLEKASKKFMSRAPVGKTGLWPLIAKVQTQLDSPFLRKGLLVADCPGLSDTSEMRRTASERYLEECGMIFIVAAIQRIATDPDVRQYIRRYTNSHDIDNVVIIATKSDDTWEDPETSVEMPQEQNLVQSCREAYEEVEEEYGEAKARTSSQEELQSLKLKMDKASAEYKHSQILLRNKIAVMELQDQLPYAYRHIGLTAIPTSARVHSLYLTGIDVADIPVLSLEETGIGRIRTLLCERAQKDRVYHLSRYMKANVDTPLERVMLVLEKDPTQRKDSVFKDVEMFRSKSIKHILVFLELIKEAFDRNVIKTMKKASRSGGPWHRNIREQIGIWQTHFSHPSTLRAFIIKEGIHHPVVHSANSAEPKLEMASDWNLDLLDTVTPDIKRMAELFTNRLHDVEKDFSNFVVGKLDALRAHLEDKQEIGGIDISRILILFEIHKREFEQSLPLMFKGIEEGVRMITKGLANSHNDTKGPYLESMSGVFRKLLHKKKFGPKTKGITAKRWEELERLLLSNGKKAPLTALRDQVQSKFNAVAESALKTLDSVMSAPFQDILRDLELRFGEFEGTHDEKKYEAVREEMRKVMPLAEEQFKEARESLLELEAWDRQRAAKVKMEKVDIGGFQGINIEDDDEDDDDPGDDEDSEAEDEVDGGAADS
ncbi:Large subunit GTPase 1 [Sphaceloma murrayae]|uniref:Large subunit GTPase 1 n=1 Tax=Sphaceloma murrayae TaxID=2082308 RepID=A0A2K1QHY2_9PEZI|nr:Large subunit GTPase 1 [Sphaceloma murrayae]